MLRVLVPFVICGSLAAGQTAQEWIQQGIDAFRAAQYDEAIDNFKQAAAADPKSLEAHLHLGEAYMATIVPGTTASEDKDKIRNAQQAFARVLKLDPKNLAAMSSLASLSFAQTTADGSPERYRLLDESRVWQTRLLELQPDNRDAHYALGVIAWSKFYPAWQASRSHAGLALGDPGPFKDPKLRAAMRKEWGPVIEEGAAHLQRAIALDPAYDEAMSRLNLLIRERADFADNQYAYLAEIAKADALVKRAIEIRKRR